MYGISIYIWVIYRVKVSKYTLHGASGIYIYMYIYTPHKRMIMYELYVFKYTLYILYDIFLFDDIISF